jgi:hypothetical protein
MVKTAYWLSGLKYIRVGLNCQEEKRKFGLRKARKKKRNGRNKPAEWTGREKTSDEVFVYVKSPWKNNSKRMVLFRIALAILVLLRYAATPRKRCYQNICAYYSTKILENMRFVKLMGVNFGVKRG